MNKLISSIILIFFFIQGSFSQERLCSVSGAYRNISFEEFVIAVEKATPCRFYYKQGWVKDILVNVTVENMELDKLLIEILNASDLKFHIESDHTIILYKGKQIVETLPDYKVYSTVKQDSNIVAAQEALTSVEKDYIEGRKVAKFDLFTVGSKQQSIPGESYIVSGRISDQETGEPVIGASLYIEELKIGAATDRDGHYSLALMPGMYLVEANSLSMKKKAFYLEVFSAGKVPVTLEKEPLSIKEITIIANRNDNVEGMQMGFERLSAKTMKEIPAVLGERDLLKVAQMLPGVQSSGEGSSGLNVRGGTADQNLFYINKLPVYNTSHLFGFFSAFSPDIVSDFSLYKSNIPAKYGGRVSSVFDITTRQGNKKKLYGQGGLSPVTGHIAVEGPIIKDKSSFVLSYRGTYSDWLLSQIKDLTIKNSNASFYDLSGTVHSKINERNILKIFTYRSFDRFSLWQRDDYSYSNTGGTVRWKHFFESSLNVEVSAISSQYAFDHTSKSNPSEAYSQAYRLNHHELKADFAYVTSKNHQLSFGASGILYQLDRGDIIPFGSESTRIPVDLGRDKGIESAVYLSDEFSFSSKLSVLAGLRYSIYTLLGAGEVNEYFPDLPKDENNVKGQLTFANNELVKFYSGFEPRIALNYKLAKNKSVKASYNMIRQYIFMLSNTLAISPTDQWKLSDYHIKPQVSNQLSIGYYHNFPEKGLESSFEAYFKRTNNVVEYKDGADFISGRSSEMDLLQGQQESMGVELMLKKKSGKLTGWISYAFSNSMVQVGSSFAEEQINFGKKYPSNFDRPHSLNLVSNLRAGRRFSISTNVVYSTGRPISYPLGLYQSEGQEFLYYSGRNQFRIPDYFRVDFSFNVEGNLLSKKWIHSSWMLNIYNLTGRKNAYSVYFESNSGNLKGYKFSVFGQPILTLSWNFKFGNYASE